MKIVFLCLDHFPYNGACTNLLLKLIKGKIDTVFNDIHVITIRKSYQEPKKEKKDGITIHRIVNWQMVDILPGKNILIHPYWFFRTAYKKLIAKIKRFFCKGIPFLDKTTVGALKHKIQEINFTQDDVLIPVAGSYTAVQAAIEYSKKNKSHIIVYQVDPCSTNQVFSKASIPYRKSFELQMYEIADAIISTPIILKEIVARLSEEQKAKAFPAEFPNVNPVHTTCAVNSALQPQKEWNCVFAGTVYKNVRDPSYAFKLFSALNDKKVRLHMIGVDEDTALQFVDKEHIKENIIFYGMLPLQATEKKVECADVLVNIGNIVKNQVPSKIFEYISFGKPIVNICVNRNCPSLEYLKKYPYCLNLFEDERDFESQKERLFGFIQEYTGKRVAAEVVREKYKDCTPEYCADLFIKIISETIRTNKIKS